MRWSHDPPDGSDGARKMASSGYVATKGFLRDNPGWVPIVRACLAEARRCKGEFAGAWVLHEAQKSGVNWFPNLRPLSASGILRRIDVTRGGGRAYYLMLDPDGVEEALRDA